MLSELFSPRALVISTRLLVHSAMVASLSRWPTERYVSMRRDQWTQAADVHRRREGRVAQKERRNTARQGLSAAAAVPSPEPLHTMDGGGRANRCVGVCKAKCSACQYIYMYLLNCECSANIFNISGDKMALLLNFEKKKKEVRRSVPPLRRYT